MSTYAKPFGEFQQSFLGITTIAVLAQSCLGGIAAMAVLMNGTSISQMFQLFLVVCCSMSFNGAVLSNQKPKVIFNILIVNVIVNTAIAIINFML